MSRGPLLNRVHPYPDETLLSWLWRLAQCNHLESPQALLSHLQQTMPEFPPVTLRALNRMQDEAVLQEIADLGGVSLADVHHLTFHRFADLLTRPDRQNELSRGRLDSSLVFGPRRMSYEVYVPGLSWCPHCLAEESYVRWHWHIPLVVGCDAHRCWLVEQCPECHTLMSEADIIQGQCERCGFLLADTVPVKFPEQDLLLRQQSTLLNWLYETPVSSSLKLPGVPARSLLYMLLGLRYAAQRAGNGWFFHHIPPGITVPDLDIVKRQSLTRFERGCLYATAFRGLMDWPHGFFAYLDAYRQRPGYKEDTGLRREFGVLHMSWFGRYWKHSAFDFIQAAYNDYLVDHMPACQIAFTTRAHDYPGLLKRLDYLSIPQAAHYVNVHAQSLYRLVREGHLIPHYFEQDDGMWISRATLDELLQHWSKHLTLPEVAQWLGIAPEIARELITAQLLEAVPDSAGKKWQLTYVHRDCVVAFIERLKKHTMIQADVHRRGIVITDVSIRNGSAGLGFPELWQRVCEGKLTACHPNESLLPLTDMWFWPETVVDISQTVKEEHDWITLMDTLVCLGVHRQVLEHFLEAGLLQPVKTAGRRQFFRRSDVLALRDRAVSSRQAAVLLNTSLSKILELNQQGRFSPLSGPRINRHARYVFDRYELLAWHEKHLVFSELKQLVSAAPIKLLKKHHIVPVFRNPNVYLRKEVMAAISSERGSRD